MNNIISLRIDVFKTGSLLNRRTIITKKTIQKKLNQLILTDKQLSKIKGGGDDPKLPASPSLNKLIDK